MRLPMSAVRPGRNSKPRRCPRWLPEIQSLEDRNAPDNLAPIAFGDLFSFDEDNILNVSAPGVLANDTDADNDPLTAELVDGPSVGQLTFNADGSFTYEPEENFNGQVTFTYHVFDGTDWSNVAMVTLTINPVNDPPTAVDDDVFTDEDTPVTFDVLGNDFDVDGDSFGIVDWTNPGNGTVTLNGDDSFTYMPTAGTYGGDSFSYTIQDPLGATSTATVNITVNQVGPAFDDDVITAEDEPITIDVLANDEPEDPGTLAVTGVGAAENGTAVLNADDTVTYTPNENWHGLDHFSYTVEDSLSQEVDVAQVWVLVESVNDQPVAADDLVETAEDEPVDIDPMANDDDVDLYNELSEDTLSIIDVSDPGHGQLSFNDDGTIRYTPDGDFHGLDCFTYTLWDGHEDGEVSGTVSITVGAVDDVPIAYNDAYSFEAQIPNTELRTWPIDAPGLLSNDIDYDYRDAGYNFNDLVVNTLTVDQSQLAGVVEVHANGSFEYTPPLGFHDDWTHFTYQIKDAVSQSAPATVWLYVEPLGIGPGPGDPPIAAVDEYFFAHNDVSGNVSLNDSGDPTKFILSTPPKYGRFTPLTADGFKITGEFAYTPDANNTGTVMGLTRTLEGYQETPYLGYNAYTDEFLTAEPEGLIKLQPVKADLDIHGMNENQEDLDGGLVVLPFNDPIYGWNNPVDANNDSTIKRTPRKQILLRPVTPAGWIGNVILTTGSGFGVEYGFSLVDVYTAATGGTPLTFNGTDNKFVNADIPAGGLPLYVEGAHFSYLMKDAWLKAEAEGLPGSADSVRFTVLYVDQPEVTFQGVVSADNDKKPRYEQQTTNHDAKLGSRRFLGFNNQGNADPRKRYWAWGFEVRATVNPANFSYLAVHLRDNQNIDRGLKLERDTYARAMARSGSVPPDTYMPVGTIDFTDPADMDKRNRKGNDNGPPPWTDDNPNPDGRIYDLDVPGVGMVNFPKDSIYRNRFNARSFATVRVENDYGDPYYVRAGLTRPYWLRYSIIQNQAPQGTDWDSLPNTSPWWVTGDNDAGYGGPKPVTWNLT